MVVASTMIPTVVKDLLTLFNVQNYNKYMTTDDSFRIYQVIIQFIVVLPLSNFKRLKDFIFLTIFQLFILT